MSDRRAIRLMAHLIAGYPKDGDDYQVAMGMADAGAEFIEVQFPYSDPTADGPAIQEACGVALDRGFCVKTGFGFVRRLCDALEKRSAAGKHDSVRVFIMSYAGLVVARGVKRFVDDAIAAGAAGLIVPDLMPGYDEGLYEIAALRGIVAVPVVAPSVTDERIETILALESPYLYAAIRTGITGKRSAIDDSVARFLRLLRRPKTTLIAGFGVSTHEQAVALKQYADMLVVGTAFVRSVADADREGSDPRDAVTRKVRDIIGGIKTN